MKKLLFVLMLISPIVAAEEQPPFEVQDPAASENFRQIYYAVDQLGISRNSSGFYCIDDPTFCVDPTNNFVGIGVAPGTFTLRVRGGNTNNFAIDNNGQQYTELDFQNNGVTKFPIYWDNTTPKFQFGTSGIINIGGDYIVQPQQPSFLATAPVNTADTTGDGTTFTVEYDVEIYDQGSDYDSGTYTFTAPVSGRYQFQAGILMQGITSAMTGTANFILVTSNRSYVFGYAANTYAYLGSQTLGQWGGSVIADMDASDTAFITIRIAGGTKVADVFDDSSYSYFSGTLIN